MTPHEQVFTTVYETYTWGRDYHFGKDSQGEYEGTSGYGSSSRNMSGAYVPFIKHFITSNNIQTVGDLGCGEFSCGEEIYNNIQNIEYVGYDTYSKLIKFLNKKYGHRYNFKFLDIFHNKEQILDADLYILRDVLQHWTNNEIEYFLEFLTTSKKFKYILICNSSDTREYGQDADIITGEFRPISSKHKSIKRFNPISIIEFWNVPGQSLENKNNKWIKNVSEVSLIVSK